MAKAATLFETFATEDGAVWETFDADRRVESDQLAITYKTGGPFLQTVVDYDLTDSSVYAEVYHVPSNSDETYFAYGDSGSPVFGGNQFVFVVNTTTIFFREIIAGTASDTTAAYDDTMMRWWRLRHSGTTIFWETSPDASTWTIQRQKTAGYTPSAGRIKFCGFNFVADQPADSPARFDNVNGGTPPAVTGTFAPTLAQLTGSFTGSMKVSGVLGAILNTVTAALTGRFEGPLIVTGVDGPAVRPVTPTGVDNLVVADGVGVAVNCSGVALSRRVQGIGV